MLASYRDSERNESSPFGPRSPLRAGPSAWLIPYYSVRTVALSHMISAGHVFAFDSVGVRTMPSARRLLKATFEIDRKIRFIRVAKRFRAAPPSGIESSIPTKQDPVVSVPTHIDPDVITRGAIETRRHLQTFDKRYQDKAVSTHKARGESLTLAAFGPLAAALIVGFFGGGMGAAAYEHGFFAAWARLWISTSATSRAAVTPDLVQKGPSVVDARDVAVRPEVAQIATMVEAPKTTMQSALAPLPPVAVETVRSSDPRTPGAEPKAAPKNRAEATIKKHKAMLASGSVRNAAGRPRYGRVVNSGAETPHNFLETLAHSLNGFQQRAMP